MKSPTYGNVSIQEIANILNQYYENNKKYDSNFSLTIGTDSQNFSDTKVVVVIAMRCIGHGGIYFYDINHVDKINNVKRKLNFETGLSLEMANKLFEILESDEKYEEMYMNINFAIHVDASYNPHGKTKELIPEIIGWIKACGYDCVVKPDSYTASSIADKISK